MGQVKIYGLVNESILKEIIISGGDRQYNQINIYCTIFEFREYIKPNLTFDYELNGSIKDEETDKVYLLVLASLTYFDKRFNFLASDYYCKNSNMVAEYIDDENYSAIRKYIMRKTE